MNIYIYILIIASIVIICIGLINIISRRENIKCQKALLAVNKKIEQIDRSQYNLLKVLDKGNIIDSFGIQNSNKPFEYIIYASDFKAKIKNEIIQYLGFKSIDVEKHIDNNDINPIIFDKLINEGEKLYNRIYSDVDNIISKYIPVDQNNQCALWTKEGMKILYITLALVKKLVRDEIITDEAIKKYLI